LNPRTSTDEKKVRKNGQKRIRACQRLSQILESSSLISGVTAMALTNIQIQNAKPREAVYRLSDGDSLWLEVRPTGVKIWRYRYKIAGKGNIYTIGEFAVHKGPTHDRKSRVREQVLENESTFQSIAEEWIARKEKNWTPGTAKQMKKVFKGDIYPAFGRLPIRSVPPKMS
jgi:hypothetical protein